MLASLSGKMGVRQAGCIILKAKLVFGSMILVEQESRKKIHPRKKWRKLLLLRDNGVNLDSALFQLFDLNRQVGKLTEASLNTASPPRVATLDM
jgi:hypothetical protein